jgi:hypothetical protein
MWIRFPLSLKSLPVKQGITGASVIEKGDFGSFSVRKICLSVGEKQPCCDAIVKVLILSIA